MMSNNDQSKSTTGIKEVTEKAEYDHIVRVLKSVNWKIAKAAEILKIDRSTLFRKMRKY